MPIAVTALVLILLILLFAYPFAIYPPVLAFWAARLRSRAYRKPEELPSVALVICALNEQKVIREKIENSLQLRYPKEKFSIVLVSDGSTDQTAEIARSYTNAGLTLLDRKVRRGKIANL